jgi:hypothetical protein
MSRRTSQNIDSIRRPFNIIEYCNDNKLKILRFKQDENNPVVYIYQFNELIASCDENMFDFMTDCILATPHTMVEKYDYNIILKIGSKVIDSSSNAIFSIIKSGLVIDKAYVNLNGNNYYEILGEFTQTYDKDLKLIDSNIMVIKDFSARFLAKLIKF